MLLCAAEIDKIRNLDPRESSEMRHFTTLLASLATILSVAFGASFTNPLKATDGSDPFVVYSGDGYYYLLTTTWSDIRLTRAKTVAGLKTGESKVVWSDKTASRCCNIWAPEVHWIDNSWWIYYTAGNSANLDGQRSFVIKGLSSIVWYRTTCC